MGFRLSRTVTRQVKVSILGVQFQVELPSNLPFESVFSVLQAFPRPKFQQLTDEINWCVRVSFDPSPVVPDGGECLGSHELLMEPAGRLHYRLTVDHVVCMESQRAVAWVFTKKRTAALYLRNAPDEITRKLAGMLVSEALRAEGYYTVHAAALELAGKSVLICAPSGAGKSTVACAWASIGRARFMSDDRCLLQRRDGVIWAGGIPEPIALTEASCNLLANLEVQLPRWQSERSDKRAYESRDVFGDLSLDAFPVGGLILLSDRMSPEDSPQPCPAAKASHFLLQSSLHWGAKEVLRDHFETLLEVLRQAPVFIVPARADLRKLVSSLEERLGTSPLLATPPAHHRRKRPSPDVPPHKAMKATRTLCALASGEAAYEATAGFTTDDWRSLLKLAEHHKLLPSVGRALERDRALSRLPNGLRNVIRSAREQSFASHIIHLAALEEIRAAFEKHQITWCALKGSSIAERFYSYPEDRCYFDLDLLIFPSQLAQAEAALSAIGFLPSPGNMAVKSPAQRGERAFVKYMPCQILVELHWDYVTSSGMRRHLTCDLNVVLQRRQSVPVSGSVIQMPSLADQFVGACVHATHGHQWDCLLHLLDLARMAPHLKEADLASAVTEARRLKVFGTIGLVVRRANTFFPSPDLHRLMDTFSPNVLDLLMAKILLPPATTVSPWIRSHRIRRKIFRAMLKHVFN